MLVYTHFPVFFLHLMLTRTLTRVPPPPPPPYIIMVKVHFIKISTSWQHEMKLCCMLSREDHISDRASSVQISLPQGVFWRLSTESGVVAVSAGKHF